MWPSWWDGAATPPAGVRPAWNRQDHEAVAAALAATGTVELADRPIDELSGGQRQRVWIAMALAQQTDILLLDEPTTFLDVAHQVDVLDLLTDLNRQHGTTIVMVLHDLNLAARYSLSWWRCGRAESLPPAHRRRW
ncbi:MAG: ABC transporter ATP-binding protein [Acidimicrobiales bacterium]